MRLTTWAAAVLVLSGCATPMTSSTPMTFFVTSSGPGRGADLGGLEGADKHCQQLATAAGAGDRTWRAYLSTQGKTLDDSTVVHARDRIGTGPWHNAKGVRIASSVDDLHGSGNRITTATALDENGQRVNDRTQKPPKHDILTGSRPDGTPFGGGDLQDMTGGNRTKATPAGSPIAGTHDRIGPTDRRGGVPGLWVQPADWRSGGVIVHLHGGWFNFGSAKAYRHLVGHIAARAGARAFIPDYRLAPEHPFPAATDDVLACYRGLVQRDVHRIAFPGDSAGGNLALVLASRVTGGTACINAALVGVAVLSPVTDLTLSGATYETRADADPLFTRPQVAELVHAYLGSADAKHPLASPLHGRHSGMPSTRIHVGDDEVLLDDSLRYVERAVAAGVDARADVWMGMPPGFPGSIGRLKAAALALDAIGAFLAERLRAH